MGLKILHSADWHLGASFSAFSEDQQQMLKQAQRSLPGRIGDICRAEGCDLALLSGDLLDGTVSRDWVRLLRDGLAAFEVPVLISPGNHDCCIPGSPWLEEKWPENVHVFSGALSSVVIPELDCRVYGAGYESMDCQPLLEGFRAEGQERYCLAVLHGDPLRPDSPYCPVTREQVQESGLDYLALGHIHKRGQMAAGGTLCGWPGCPMGRGWDETGEKGVYLVTLEEGASAQFLPLDTPRFYQMEAVFSTDAAEDIRRVLPVGGSQDFYRVLLTGRGTLETNSVKLPEYPNLQWINRVKPPVDLWQETQSDSLMGIYFRILQERMEMDNRALLAAELSRRLLDGEEVALP